MDQKVEFAACLLIVRQVARQAFTGQKAVLCQSVRQKLDLSLD